jgi:hypothetical protein
MKTSRSYIEKCVNHKKGIDILLEGVQPIRGFKVGDCFHCQTLMDPDECEIVKEIKSDQFIYAECPDEKYLIAKSVLLPTEEQLKAGCEKNLVDLDNYDPGIGAEALFDMIIKTDQFKRLSGSLDKAAR